MNTIKVVIPSAPTMYVTLGAGVVGISGYSGYSGMNGAFTASGYSGYSGDTSTSPVITSGNTAPSSIPGKIGDIYVNTTIRKVYVATGTSSSFDWTLVN
jgi:hypothetical protein